MTSVQGRALTGDAGYKRMIRLVVRAFYAGECPPSPPVDPAAPLPQNASKLNKARRRGELRGGSDVLCDRAAPRPPRASAPLVRSSAAAAW